MSFFAGFLVNLRDLCRGHCQDTKNTKETKKKLNLNPCVLCVLGFLVVSLLSGCTDRPTTGLGAQSASLDLTSRFSAPGAALKGAATGAFDRHYPVVRKGRCRDAMLLIAPVTAWADVGGIAGSYFLEALCTQVFNTGDGIQMDIYLTERGARRKICSRYFDAGRRAEDRDWIPVSIPLVLGQTQNSRIEIEASAGAQGDLVGDWLALSSVRLVPRKEAQ